MKETIQGTGSWGPEPPGPGTTYSNPRRERLRWPLPPKPRLKSGGGFGPDPGSGTTVPTRRLPAPRPSFDASASEEEEEEEEEDEEEEVAAWRLPPRWGHLGASQRPRPLRPSHRKTCSQRRRRAMRAFQMLLYSKSTSLTFHWKLWGRHRGRRRNLAHTKNHLSPQEGGATPQVPSPCCRFDSPRGPPPPRLGLLGALMAEDGMRGSSPVPSGPPMEEDGLRWTPKSPLDPDSGKVGNGVGRVKSLEHQEFVAVVRTGPKDSRVRRPGEMISLSLHLKGRVLAHTCYPITREAKTGTVDQGLAWPAKKAPILWEWGNLILSRNDAWNTGRGNRPLSSCPVVFSTDDKGSHGLGKSVLSIPKPPSSWIKAYAHLHRLLTELVECELYKEDKSSVDFNIFI